MSRKDAEKLADKVNFQKGNGLVPAIVQDASTNQVLMQAYMNRESFIMTLLTGKTHFWSRTRNKLWMKGEESGHFSLVQNLSLDCDDDTVLVRVQQIGPACHTNKVSCFNKPVLEEDEAYPNASVLDKIYQILLERIKSGDEKSYTKRLVESGESSVLRKISEESTEVILAAKDKPDTLVSEVTDLVFHLLVLLALRKITLEEIFKELEKRHREKTSSR